MSPASEAGRPRRRKMQARYGAPAKGTTTKPARGVARVRRKPDAGQLDSVLAAQLEIIARSLEQISDMRAELGELRAIVEELAQNVAALLANSTAPGHDLEFIDSGGNQRRSAGRSRDR